MSVAIITDTNSGISQEEADKLGIYLLPMPFSISGTDYLEGVNLSHDEFYEKQLADEDILTSQPSPAQVTDMWDELLNKYDCIVHMPMSSALSASCQTAIMLSNEEEYKNKVYVVDNLRISAMQRQAAIDAKQMVDMGMSPEEVVARLMEARLDTSVYLMVDNLKYLKKGGRITAAAAAIGTLLRIKPVLTIQGGKIEPFAKARTLKQAKEIMLQAMADDMKNKFGDVDGSKTNLTVVYAKNHEQAREYAKEIQQAFPKVDRVDAEELPFSIITHTGPGVISITASKKLDIEY